MHVSWGTCTHVKIGSLFENATVTPTTFTPRGRAADDPRRAARLCYGDFLRALFFRFGGVNTSRSNFSSSTESPRSAAAASSSSPMFIMTRQLPFAWSEIAIFSSFVIKLWFPADSSTCSKQLKSSAGDESSSCKRRRIRLSRGSKSRCRSRLGSRWSPANTTQSKCSESKFLLLRI